MSSFLAQWVGMTSPGRRRSSFLKSIPRVEDLEARVVLSRASILPDAPDVPSMFAVEPTVESACAETASSSATFKVATGKKKNEVIDIKQWQGTWNISDDIPFLSNGTLQIHQIAEKKFEATTTGLSGNQFFAFKAMYTKDGDPQLHFKIKGQDLEGKPKVVGFLVDLNLDTLASFHGIAKVSGGHDVHSITGILQPGTAPTTADVSITTDEFHHEVSPGGEYTFFVFVLNKGTAAIPNGGVKVEITFLGNLPTFVSATNSLGVKAGFTSVTPSVQGDKLVLTCIGSAISGTNRSTLSGTIKLTAPATGGFTYSAKLIDNNGGTVPNFPEATSTVVVVSPL